VAQASNKSGLNRVDRYRKDNRNGRRRRFGRRSRRSAAGRDNYGDLAMDQFGRQYRQSIVLVFRPAIFDRYV
jgi:hypothetical protein